MTNKGVGGLLKKWGEGASLIRKEWKAREGNGEEGKEGGEGFVGMKSHRTSEDNGMAVDDEDDDDDEDEDEEEEDEDEPDDLEATPRMLPRRTIGVHSPSSLSSPPDTHPANHDHNTDGSIATNNDLTNLTESLNSLSLVPNSIRFGRGGKSGGFIRRGQGRARGGGSRGGKHGKSGGDVMEVDVVPVETRSLAVPGHARSRGRGRGSRANGRGRGRGVAQAA